MSNYPNSIFDPRIVANVPGESFDDTKTTRLFAEDVNLPNDEIVAIEQTLGENPQGMFDTVADFLAYLSDNIGSGGIADLDGGTAFGFYSALDPIDGGSA